MRVMSVTSQIDMTLGERQILQVLTTLQYLAKMGPKSPPPRHVADSMQSIMRPLKQAGISFTPHSVLGYSTSIRLSNSVEMDVSCANISSLPLSVGLAGDMSQPGARPRDYESAMGGMTLDSASSMGTGDQDIKEEEKNPKIKVKEDKVNTE